MLKFNWRPLRTFWGGYFKRTFRKGMLKGFNDLGEALTDYSRNNHPTFRNRTRKLARSLQWSSKGVRGNVSSDVEYSTFLYYGTKRHFVAPVNKTALSWSQGGTRFFSKGHWVSGIKKSEWIEKNYEDREIRFNAMVREQILREFGT